MVVGEFTTETELVVIGGGPGGYSAALRAAELGLETTIIDDRERLGGSWLHEGCVLSKNLVQIADIVRAAKQASSFGVTFGPPRYDLDRIRAALAATVDHISDELDKACDARGVTRIHGRATFDDSRQLTVQGATSARLHFRRAVIATGCHAPDEPGIPWESPRVLSQSSALTLPMIPPTLLVCGAGTTAIELAGAYAALGSRVTLAVSSERLVPAADEDLVAAMRENLDTVLAEVHVDTRVVSAEDRPDGMHVTFERGRGGQAPPAATFDAVLAISPRRANVEGLGLERTKVTRDGEGFIIVNDRLTTADPRILAVGDVTGAPLLAQRAMHQARIAAEVVAGWGSAFDVRAAPMVLFTSPPVAWCGLTERDAALRGQTVDVSRTSGLAGQGRGIAPDNSLTKIIYDPDTSLVLGLGVVGPGAAEMIAEGALAIEMGAVTGDLAATLHPHPTRSESIARAALKAQQPPGDGSQGS